MYTGQEIIFLVFKYIFIQGYSRRDQFGDSPFYNFLCKFGIFELFANGNPLAGPYQFGQIGVDGMIRETGQFHKGGRSIGPAGKGNTQNIGCFNSIFTKSFIKVTDPEQQNGIRMLCFDAGILLHQRRVDEIVFFQNLILRV